MDYHAEGQVDRVMDIGAYKLQEIFAVCKRFASIHVIYKAYLRTIHLPGFYLEERMLTFSLLSICVPELWIASQGVAGMYKGIASKNFEKAKRFLLNSSAEVKDWLLLVKNVQEEKKQVFYFSCLDPLWDVKTGTEQSIGDSPESIWVG